MDLTIGVLLTGITAIYFYVTGKNSGKREAVGTIVTLTSMQNNYKEEHDGEMCSEIKDDLDTYIQENLKE